ncbi:MAG: ATP-binding protein [Dehalococcoidia bacterium]|nr:ATP-binding protein [Dehalococcoidia bacterium]
MRHPFSGIGLRLSLSHLLVILLAMGLSSFLLLSFLGNYFTDAARKNLLAQAQITAQALVPGAVINASDAANETGSSAYNVIQQNQTSNIALNATNLSLPTPDSNRIEMDLNYLRGALPQLNIQLQTRIRILDANGLVLVDSRQEQESIDLSDESLVARALQGETASRTDKSGPDMMNLALPVMIDGRLVGIVYLSQPLSDVNAVLHDLRTRLAIAAGIALALSAIVALLLSRAISSPVRRMTRAARAVAGGDLDQQVSVGSKDELGELGQAFNDMTARLKASRQQQIDFVADVSHESRTPLTSIKGMVETLRDGAAEEPEVRDRFLKTIEEETDRLIRLVNDLLLLSQADSTALTLCCEASDIRELAGKVIDRMTPQARDKKLILKLESSSDLPLVRIDPDRIEQVLVNLIDNAIKYSIFGGTVTMKLARSQDGRVLVSVCDEGIGISAQDLPHIGERFYRTDKARSRAMGGTGLGLAIARALVKAHGSELVIESTLAQGTTVSFTLSAD